MNISDLERGVALQKEITILRDWYIRVDEANAIAFGHCVKGMVATSTDQGVASSILGRNVIAFNFLDGAKDPMGERKPASILDMAKLITLAEIKRLITVREDEFKALGTPEAKSDATEVLYPEIL